MRRATGLIIGSHEDLHVRSVLEFTRQDSVLVMDIESLSASPFVYKDSSFQIETERGWLEIGLNANNRGWFRRLAPQDWQRGVQIGSMEAVEKTAWLSLMGALSRTPHIAWLTNIDDALIAENKLYQLEVARRAGIRTPRTIVSNLHQEVASELPEDRIVKPLGPGHFFKEGIPFVMYTQSASDSESFNLLGSPPLIFQERLDAKTHLRVVVVEDSVWAASLDADELPIDWRSESEAHSSFVEIIPPADVRAGALLINSALRLGYSSQDWIVTLEGAFLVDVNPGGQWMFLPEKINLAVSRAIAKWIEVSHD